jgi:ribosomal-protein-alanine N-acetyltransferase
MTITTSRLQLRPFTPQSLLALIEGEEAFQCCFGLRAAEGLRSFFVSGEVSPQWLAQLRGAAQANPWKFGFAVIDHASGLVVGSAGFKAPPDETGATEVAYGIVPSFEGKGYATEAARELVAFAFADPRVRLVRAHTLPENNASTRVLTKNGFTKLGEVIDPDDGRVWRWERNRTAV